MFENARDIAVDALRDRSGNVTAHLDRVLESQAVEPAERALARELALGTLRRQATLQAVLRKYLAQPGRQLPAPMPQILHVALYQLLFLERIPQFAAVNEAVAQAQRFGHIKQGGLVNGVLRTLLRSISPLESQPPPLAPDVIPISPWAFRRADRAIFPDPRVNPPGYLADAYSLPYLLAERWAGRLGLETAVAVAMQANVRAPLVARVNTLRTDVKSVLARLSEEGVQAQPHENGLSIVLPHEGALQDLSVFRDGLIQPQDPTATAVAIAVAPKSGQRVLDFCAAPGTKTTHLAEIMKNTGSLTAVDVSGEKLAMIESNCRRLGISIVQTHPADRAGELEHQGYDVVLADVPCSNTGVLARRAEARWRFTPKHMADLVKTQRDIALAAAWFVKPGGRMVYSTCSIEPEEGPAIVRWVLGRVSHIRMVRELLTLPGGADNPAKWHDGGYYAILSAG